MRSLVALVALTSASAAQASSWVDVATGQDNTQYLVDGATINANAGKPVFWEKAVNADKSYAMFQMSVDCSQHTWQMWSALKYNADGSIISSRSYAGYERSDNPTPPDTVIYMVGSTVCGALGLKF